METGKAIRYSLAILTVLFLIDSFLIEPYAIQVTYNSFHIFRDGGEPVKIVLISDIHAAYDSPDYFNRSVALINAEDADLVLIGGDIAEGNPGDIKNMNALGTIKARYGVFAVLGNHDYGPAWSDGGYADSVERKLEDAGIEVLRNENKVLEINNKKFALVGIDDFWAKRSDYGKATAGLPGSIPKIILVHNQESVESQIIGEGIVLDGHTHCGGVRLPLLGSIPKLVNFKGDIDMGRGVLPQGNEIYTTCGLTPGGMRFLTRPEISVIYVD